MAGNDARHRHDVHTTPGDSSPDGPAEDPSPTERPDHAGGGADADPATRQQADVHAELAAAREHIAELYDFAPIAYCTLDRNGLVIDMNLRCTNLLGGERDRLLGRPLLSHVDRTDRRALLDHLFECRTGTGPSRTELWLRPAHADPVYVQLFSHPTGHRNPDHYLTAIIDQTEHFETQRTAAEYKGHLEDLNHELEHRAREAELRTKQLQALTLQVIHAEHSERRRIARFIHDQLQQLLVTAKLQTGMLADKTASRVEEKAHRMRELLDTAIARSRDLSHELCPPVLYDYGLAEALEWLAGEYRGDQLMDVQVEVADPAIRISDQDLEVFLFETVRELLLNALKNGGATTAIVTLGRDDGDVTLSVEDNGAGSEPEYVGLHRAAPGIGLSVIRERLDMLGGTMNLDTATGKGFRVALRCPTDFAPASAPDIPPSPDTT